MDGPWIVHGQSMDNGWQLHWLFSKIDALIFMDDTGLSMAAPDISDATLNMHVYVTIVFILVHSAAAQVQK